MKWLALKCVFIGKSGVELSSVGSRTLGLGARDPQSGSDLRSPLDPPPTGSLPLHRRILQVQGHVSSWSPRPRSVPQLSTEEHAIPWPTP